MIKPGEDVEFPPIAWGLQAAELAWSAFEAAADALDDEKPSQSAVAFHTGLEHLRHARECMRRHLAQPPTAPFERRALAELVCDVVEAGLEAGDIQKRTAS